MPTIALSPDTASPPPAAWRNDAAAYGPPAITWVRLDGIEGGSPAPDLIIARAPDAAVLAAWRAGTPLLLTEPPSPAQAEALSAGVRLGRAAAVALDAAFGARQAALAGLLAVAGEILALRAWAPPVVAARRQALAWLLRLGGELSPRPARDDAGGSALSLAFANALTARLEAGPALQLALVCAGAEIIVSETGIEHRPLSDCACDVAPAAETLTADTPGAVIAAASALLAGRDTGASLRLAAAAAALADL